MTTNIALAPEPPYFAVIFTSFGNGGHNTPNESCRLSSVSLSKKALPG
jgi:hypothetical protein